MTVSCQICKKSYPISDGDNPDNYACECGGKLYFDTDKTLALAAESPNETNELVDEKEKSFALRNLTISKVLIILPGTVAFFWFLILAVEAWKHKDFDKFTRHMIAMLAIVFCTKR